ncbi:MAG: peroxiredoxin-like family protein [Nodosilinea sp.]
MNSYETLVQTQRQRVSDGENAAVLTGCEGASRVLVLVWPQLGDFDSLEYAWWLQREAAALRQRNVAVRAVGIGDRASGQQFCTYTGFPAASLFVDETAALHRDLKLYEGLTLSLPGLTSGQSAWLNLMLMCAGVASPGTLKEVLRGYTGDRRAPQLIGNETVVKAGPLPPLTGKTFRSAGGEGFQRPFELATLRLRNMTEVLSHWGTYVPNAAYLTQRGGTFLFNRGGDLLYEHRDRGILGFAATMANPLAFLEDCAPAVGAL